jgi:hypothetical protein
LLRGGDNGWSGPVRGLLPDFSVGLKSYRKVRYYDSAEGRKRN